MYIHSSRICLVTPPSLYTVYSMFICTYVLTGTYIYSIMYVLVYVLWVSCHSGLSPQSDLTTVGSHCGGLSAVPMMNSH